MAQENIKNKPLNEGEVKPREDVTVYGTGKSKYIAKDEAVTIHRALAEKLAKEGKVTDKAPKSAESKA